MAISPAHVSHCLETQRNSEQKPENAGGSVGPKKSHKRTSDCKSGCQGLYAASEQRSLTARAKKQKTSALDHNDEHSNGEDILGTQFQTCEPTCGGLAGRRDVRDAFHVSGNAGRFQFSRWSSCVPLSP